MEWIRSFFSRKLSIVKFHSSFGQHALHLDEVVPNDASPFEPSDLNHLVLKDNEVSLRQEFMVILAKKYGSAGEIKWDKQV